jgi:hypothetical protein
VISNTAILSQATRASQSQRPDRRISLTVVARDGVVAAFDTCFMARLLSCRMIDSPLLRTRWPLRRTQGDARHARAGGFLCSQVYHATISQTLRSTLRLPIVRVLQMR